MWKNINLDECLRHIHAKQLNGGAILPEPAPAITISRMCGSGGRSVASRLAEYLQPHAPWGKRWTIFDRELIKKVLEDHLLSPHLADVLPESCKSRVAELIAKLRDRRPAAATIVEQTVETVWQLAEGGYVILVGRGANVITARLHNVFHVRLISSVNKRIERVEEIYDFDRRAALEYIKAQDSAKKLYLKEYFGYDIEDPLLYHLIINTDYLSYEDAAKVIGDAVMNWFKQATPAQAG